MPGELLLGLYSLEIVCLLSEDVSKLLALGRKFSITSINTAIGTVFLFLFHAFSWCKAESTEN